MKRLLSFVVLMLFPSLLGAAEPQVFHLAAVAYINGGSVGWNRGTCFPVSSNPKGQVLYLTAAHNILDEAHSKPLKTIKIYDGDSWIESEWSTYSFGKGPDLAVVMATPKKVPRVAALSSSLPAAHQPLFVSGFPRAGNYKVYRGAAADENNRVGWLQMQEEIIQGTSGGPVFGESGEVFGVISGSRKDGQSWHTNTVVARKWIESVAKVRFGDESPADAVPPPPDERLKLYEFSQDGCPPCVSWAALLANKSNGVRAAIDAKYELVKVHYSRGAWSNQLAVDAMVSATGNSEIATPSFWVEGSKSVMYSDGLLSDVNASAPKAYVGVGAAIRVGPLGVGGGIGVACRCGCGKPNCRCNGGVCPVPTAPQATRGPMGPQGPQGPAGADADVSGLLLEIKALRDKVAELEARKLPDIPVELYDAETGEKVSERMVPLGQPIQLYTRRKAK